MEEQDRVEGTGDEGSAELTALAELRAEFTGHRFFRSVRSDGRLGEWVATLHDPRAGVDATVMRPTAGELRAALIKEAELARHKRDRFLR